MANWNSNLTAAINNWNAANQSNGSNIQFSFWTGKSAPPAKTTLTINASSGQYVDSNGNTQPNTYAYTTYNGGKATTTWYLGSNVINTSASSFAAFVTKGQDHEIGHPMGLNDQTGDCSTQTAQQSAMNMSCGINDANGNLPSTISSCDNQSISATYGGSGSSGGGNGGSAGGGSSSPSNNCSGPSPLNCGPNYSAYCTAEYGWYCTDQCLGTPPEPCCDDCYESCQNGIWACIGSPILVDVFGTGFHLTDISSGVRFRVLPNDDLRQMSWPDPLFRNGWLALDRNGDGQINDFTELFGNATRQPKSQSPNGYLALAVFDDPANGGNGNGMIDPGDAVFDHLLIWIDDNHNGISEKEELYSLRDAGIFRIDLSYYPSQYVDENGNQFRYKSKIWDEAGTNHETCYDVFVRIAN